MHQKVDGEDELMIRWMPQLRAMSKRIWHPHRLGMNHDDMFQELALVVTTAIRRHAWDYGGLPADPFIRVVSKRRVGRSIRAATVPFRIEAGRETGHRDDDGQHVAIEIPDTEAVGPDEAESKAELADVCEGLVYALRRNLPPAAFAILYLRFVEELSPTEIAEMAGRDPEEARRAGKRLDHAKAVAREFLRGLGIGSIEQAGRVKIGDFDANELD